MNAIHYKRLWVISSLLLLVSVVVALILFALQQNINLFFTPKEIFSGTVPLETRIRVGGMVEKGSLKRGKDLEVHFKITDYNKTLSIQYQGILPDLFQEGQGVVAMGKLKSADLFIADEILAKHDENYMPSELESLKVGEAKTAGEAKAIGEAKTVGESKQ